MPASVDATWTCGGVFRYIQGTGDGDIKLHDYTRNTDPITVTDADCSYQGVLPPGRYLFRASLAVGYGDLTEDRMSITTSGTYSLRLAFE